jgi:hypothetical protein
VSLRGLSALLGSPWHEERLLALLILVRRLLRDDPHDLIHKAVGYLAA